MSKQPWPLCKYLTQHLIRVLLLSVSLCCANTSASTQNLLIAVASNFKPTCKQLALEFDQRNGNSTKTTLSSASTATLYKQIKYGAHFDLFLSADTQHIEMLGTQGFMTPASSVDYAQGILVMLSREKHSEEDIIDFVRQQLSNKQQRIALANPLFAPYGHATVQSLKTIGIWDTVKNKIIRANNVSQTLQYFDSGNTDFAFTALSLVTAKETYSNIVLIPQSWHSPIIQRGGIVTRSNNKTLAKQFLKFLQSPRAQQIIQNNGYRLPNSKITFNMKNNTQNQALQ